MEENRHTWCSLRVGGACGSTGAVDYGGDDYGGVDEAEGHRLRYGVPLDGCMLVGLWREEMGARKSGGGKVV